MSNVLLICSESSYHWATVNTGTLTLKLGDFGLSRGFSLLRENETTLTVVGTVDMMAPEVKQAYMDGEQTAKYGTKADIWPIGMIAHLAAKGMLPSKHN